MKKLVSLLLTIVLLSTLVATSAFAEDKVTIEILSLKNEQAAQDAFAELFAGFQKQYPNVEFNLQSMFFAVVLPLMRPVMATIAVLNALWVWGEFLVAFLVYGTKQPMLL